MTHAPSTPPHHRVVIAGGGTAGLSVAARLLRQSPQLDVAVIDPSEDHDYQPGWTLVGGDMRAEDTRRRQADVIRNSRLAGDAGWVSVDKHRLTHTRYANVFALGDCTGTPNAKTIAAIRRQVPVLAGELRHALGESAETCEYDGYGACPLTVAHGKVLLAEFRYGGEVVSSFPLDPRGTRRIHWPLKTRFFPWLYWNVMLNGKDWHWPRPKLRPELTE